MIYNNLIYFLIAIFTFTMASEQTRPLLPWWANLASLILLLILFDRAAFRLFNKPATHHSSGYFKTEKRASISALCLFAVMVFGLDLKYYLAILSIDGRIPSLINIAGLLFFLFLLMIVWNRAKPSYEAVFLRPYSRATFLLSNIKANLPIVIPWMLLTLCYDLLFLLPWPALHELLESNWGDFLFFGAFLIFIFLFFPPLVRTLWGCKKIEPGALRDHLHDFCQRQNFSAEFFIWPLFEGRVITAGVMGVFPGLRYILITPALLETMNRDELDAVMAHEIGHVKRFHLLLYVALIGGFSIAMGLLAEPAFYLFFGGDFFYRLVEWTTLSPGLLRNILAAVPSLVLLLLFFRFIFGYFMRNFERQADLHVFTVQGTCYPIISAFEKIALLSGNIRDQPSWHHFGIGQRVDFLRRCHDQPATIARHHRKVAVSLLLFALVIAGGIALSQTLSLDAAITRYEQKFSRADLSHQANQEPYPARWLTFAGGYLIEHNQEKRATIAFELAFELEPAQPLLLNNYAWLLLTAHDTTLRDPARALRMARAAAQKTPKGAFLDTLATAWWANGFLEQAIKTEKAAIFIDPDNSTHYRQQIARFQRFSYDEEMKSRTTNSTSDKQNEG